MISTVDYSASSAVYDIWGFSDGVLLFGNWKGTVSRYDHNGWVDPLAQLDDRIVDIWGTSSSDFYVLTWSTLHRCVDGGWSEIRPGGRALWGSPDGHLFLADNDAIRRFDGAVWTQIDTVQQRYVNGIWGVSSSEVFFAGWKNLLRLDGDSLEVFPGEPGVYYNDVWGSSPGDVFVVGTGGHVLHFDGTNASQMTRVTVDDIVGVWGSGPNDVYAVTDEDVLYYNGADWSVLPVRDYQSYRSVWGDGPGEVYLGGDHGRVLKYDGQDAEMIRGEQPMTVGAAWADPSTGELVVSEGSRIFRYGSGRWKELAANRLSAIRHLWGRSIEVLYATGCPRITRFDGREWSSVTSLPYSPSAVWNCDANRTYLAGNDILVFDGAGVDLILDGDKWIKAIHGSSPANVYAVGYERTGGHIVRFDGIRWEYVAVDHYDDFYDVWVVSETEVYVVGSYHGVLRFNGSKLSVEPMPPGRRYLKVLWGGGSADLYAAGGTSMFHYNGAVWSPEYARGGVIFSHIEGVPGGPVYAVINHLDIMKKEQP